MNEMYLHSCGNKYVSLTLQSKSCNRLDKWVFNLVSLQKIRKEIENGTLIYKRFSQEEQRGFIEGGSIHVEASLITGRSVGTSEDQDARNDRQESEMQKRHHLYKLAFF